MTWIWSSLWIHPRLEEPIRVRAEWSKFNPLFLLLRSFLFIPILHLSLHWTVSWVINIDVGAWSRIGRFYFFVTCPVIATTESSMNCFLCHNLVFYIIFLFLMIILSGPRVLWESLSGVGSLTLMLPKFSPLGLSEEGLRLLANELAIWILLLMFLGSILYRKRCFVRTWSRKRCFYHWVLAVRYLGLKYFVFTGRVELLLSKLVEVINAWTRIACPRLIIVLVVRLFKQSSVYFAQMELVLRELRMYFGNLRSVGGWTHLVEASSSIGSGSQFSCGNAWSHRIRNHSMFPVLLSLILQVLLINRLQLIPLWLLVIVAGVGILQVSGTLNKPRTRCRWTETIYLF